jgi:hypothetical protein
MLKHVELDPTLPLANQCADTSADTTIFRSLAFAAISLGTTIFALACSGSDSPFVAVDGGNSSGGSGSIGSASNGGSGSSSGSSSSSGSASTSGAGSSSGTRSGSRTGSSTSTGTSSDAGSSSGSSGGGSSGSDSGGGDAGMATQDAGTIACGANLMCVPPQECCAMLGFGGRGGLMMQMQTCVAAGACPDGGIVQACSSAANCATGDVCCRMGTGATSCAATCPAGSAQACASTTECPAGQTCIVPVGGRGAGTGTCRMIFGFDAGPG